jgi:signal peptidase II
VKGGSTLNTRQKQLAWIGAAFFLILCADQASKAVVRATIPWETSLAERRDDEFFYFTHERNRGLVGGMFRDSPAVAYTAPLLATAVLLYLFKHLEPNSRFQAAAYGLVAGGAVGNVIDRFWLGYVTDFFQFHFYFIPFDFPWKRYPAFNVADSAICIGVFLLIMGWHKAGKTHVADHR